MKTYRVVLLDFTRKNPTKVKDCYVKGLKNARAVLPFSISYSHNSKAFTGWSGKLNAIVKEV